MTTELLAHSPLGASGAERWMECPGSVPLSAGGSHDEEDDTFSRPGQAAHALAEHCLTETPVIEAWTQINEGMPTDTDDFEVDVEMANSIQDFLDILELKHPEAERNQGNFFVERKFHCPTIHKLFYGTADIVALQLELRVIDIWDFKYGAGIVIEANRNVQIMYYAAGVLEEMDLWDKVDLVRVHIYQPRGWHHHGPHRDWSISVQDLRKWVDDELVPAMNKAQVSRDTKSGEHCRFCPVRYYNCPQIAKDMTEFEELTAMVKSPEAAKELTNDQVGRYMSLLTVAKIAVKAATKLAYTRLNANENIPGFKLAAKRSNREWNDDAAKALKKKYKGKEMTEPELHTPAQIDALPGGEAMTKRYAYKPHKGLTVVPADDSRAGVSMDTKAAFKPVKKGKK